MQDDKSPDVVQESSGPAGQVGHSETQRLTAAREAWRALERAIRATSSTDAGVIERLAAQGFERLSAFIDRHGPLTLGVAPENVYLEGSRLTDNGRAADNALYFAYCDGLRLVRFEPGIEAAEVERLVLALRRAAASVPDEDTITLLWSADLTHVRYHEIDPFSSEGEEADAQAREVHRLVEEAHVALRPARPHVPVSPNNIDSERWMIPAPDRLFAMTGSAQVTALAPQTRELFIAALTGIETPLLIDRYLDALVRCLAVPSEPRDEAAVHEAIASVIGQIIDSGQVRRAADLIERVRALAHDPTFPRTVPEEAAAALDRTLSSDGIVREVFSIYSQTYENRADALADITRLLVALPAHGYERLLPLIWGHPEPGIQARALSDLIRGPNRARFFEAIAQALGRMTESFALETIRAIGGTQDIASLPVFAAALDHPAPHVRFEALGQYLLHAPAREATQRAAQALSSPQAPFRRLALEFLVDVRPPEAAALVRKIVTGAMETLDEAERVRLCVALAELEGEGAASTLIGLLERHGLLGGGDLEHTRIAAATALGRLRTPQAQAALEATASARMTRQPLKSACEASLHAMKGPVTAAPAGRFRQRVRPAGGRP